MKAALASDDYRGREYLSVAEVAALTGLAAGEIHRRVKAGEMPAFRAASGQYRFRLREIRQCAPAARAEAAEAESVVRVGETVQRIIAADSRDLRAVADDSVHLALTSPPYFNAKMYSDARPGDLGNIHDLDEWLEKIGEAWAEVFRVLSPGRKFFRQ